MRDIEVMLRILKCENRKLKINTNDQPKKLDKGSGKRILNQGRVKEMLHRRETMIN